MSKKTNKTAGQMVRAVLDRVASGTCTAKDAEFLEALVVDSINLIIKTNPTDMASERLKRFVVDIQFKPQDLPANVIQFPVSAVVH